jgi:hypothetical protein
MLRDLDRLLRKPINQLPVGVARQVVRWLSLDQDRTNERITGALREALSSPDWELRISAALAAARLGAVELHSSIHRMELPRTNRSGLNELERQAVFALRQACMYLLGVESPPAASPEPLDWNDRRAMHGHVLRCVAGVETTHQDWVWLLTRALAEPLPEQPAPPEPLPAGIIQDDDGRFFLALSELELGWISPGTYWLGESANIREFVLKRGFFITVFPVTLEKGVFSPALMDLAMAQETARRLSDLEGVAVRLLAPDEWEIAARGADGRFYPWGNGYEPGWQEMPSPSGAMHMVNGLGEWAISLELTEKAVACGGDRSMRCARRARMDPDARLKTRFLIEHPLPVH